MFDTIIVGAGPAGLTAAIYLARAGKRVCLIDEEGVGGQMAKSPLIENYPGFKGSGLELADKMYDSIPIESRYFVSERVFNINFNGNNFSAETIEGGHYDAQSIIWAAGATPKRLNVSGEESDHVHYCVACDGWLYKNKEVAVIGDGNSALQYALALSEYCKRVYLLIPFDRFFGEEILINRVATESKITVYDNFMTDGIVDVNDRISIHSRDNQFVAADGAFIAIGQEPDNTAVIRFVDMSKGFISDTPMRGFYAAGDCRAKKYRQVATAIADGAIAALDCIDYLNRICVSDKK